MIIHSVDNETGGTNVVFAFFDFIPGGLCREGRILTPVESISPENVLFQVRRTE